MSKPIVKDLLEGKAGVENKGKSPVSTRNVQGPPPRGGSGAKPKPIKNKAI